MKNRRLNIFQKILVILLLSIIYYPLSIVPSFAQNELSDYQYQYEQYRQVYPEFTKARDAFLQYETLASQQEAISFTKKLLLQRDQVMRAHFLLLRRRLNEAPEIVSSERTRLASSLTSEIEWLDTNIKDIQAISTPTLGQLFELSDRFERRERSWRQLSYEVLSRILLGEVRQFQAEAGAINFLLDEYFSRQSDGNKTLLKNWLDEAKNGAYWSQQGVGEAEKALTEMLKYKGEAKETVRQFAKLQTTLTGSQQWLVKVVGFQKEIIQKVSGSQE